MIDDFVSSYARGETPNPCVRCNQRIKFSALSARALALGFDAVATGHYARLSDGRLRRAVDRDKDQSYVLAVLTARQLRHALFPIGDTPKPQIRAEAARRGLAVADKPDSHDICFIPSGDTRRFSVRASVFAAASSSMPTAPCWPPMTACTSSPSASARASAFPARAPMAARATSPPSTPKPRPFAWVTCPISTCTR
ncbi:tRNA methyl transferase family protein [Mycobacterium kansasii]|uniref:tRNA methyl transferase family protein n=1 Tax=Mycobacterium kansasii TaxID=1768 RepID=A0A1V3XV16_MYCKA|nr:tRNA methyl transferase family protein [Mycobacterium kansasii]